MQQRCEERVNRGVRELRNTVRNDLLAWMVRQCRDGLEGDRFSNLVDSTIAMLDLTDDETFPNHNISQEEVVAAMTLQWTSTRGEMQQGLIRSRMQKQIHEAWTMKVPKAMSWKMMLTKSIHMDSGLEEVPDVEYRTELHHGQRENGEPATSSRYLAEVKTFQLRCAESDGCSPDQPLTALKRHRMFHECDKLVFKCYRWPDAMGYA